MQRTLIQGVRAAVCESSSFAPRAVRSAVADNMTRTAPRLPGIVDHVRHAIAGAADVAYSLTRRSLKRPAAQPSRSTVSHDAGGPGQFPAWMRAAGGVQILREPPKRTLAEQSESNRRFWAARDQGESSEPESIAEQMPGPATEAEEPAFPELTGNYIKDVQGSGISSLADLNKFHDRFWKTRRY